MVDDGNKKNYQWLSENSSALSVDDIMSVPSASRKIVKKLIYRLAKDLAKSCPHAGNESHLGMTVTAEIELGNKACWAMFWLLVKGTIPS